MPLTRIKNTAIGDGGISTAKLADGAVTTVKVADSAVNSAKIGVDVIVADDLAANSVTVSEITDGAVTGAKLADNLNYDSGTLYLDSTNDRVGIGTTSPDGRLHIHTASAGSVTANAAADELVLENSGDAGLNILSPNANNSQILLGSPVANAGGIIRWTGDDNAVKIGTNNIGSTLRFHVGGFSEVMRIDNSGNFLVGKTSTAAGAGSELRADGQIVAYRSNNRVVYLERLGSDGNIIDFVKDGTTVGSIATFGSDLTIGTGDTRIRFEDGLDAITPRTTGDSGRDGAIDIGISTVRFKDLYLSGGVYLGGTGSANHLDDYEEGTFTPTWNGYPSPYGTSGKYVKIGTQITVYATLITDVASNSSLIQINNLPFQITGDQGGGFVYHNSVPLYAYNIYTLFTANSTICQLKTASGGAEAGVKYIGSDPSMRGYSTMHWTIVYQTT